MNEEDDPQFKQAGTEVEKFLNAILSERAKEKLSFSAGWEKLAGREIAAHVSPKDIDRGTLILEADHPGWNQTIRLHERKILTAIRKTHPSLEIKRIKIFVTQTNTVS